MLSKLATLLTLSVAVLIAADKTPTGSASNKAVEISATLYNGKDAVRQVLGSDLDGYIVVVDVQVTPKTEKPLAIHRDDFLLRSDKDGQRSKPFAPSQIAGSGALVISERGGGSAVMADNPGPVWGGYPGTGQPRRLGGDSGMIGNTAETAAEAKMHSGSKDKEDPLLSKLEEKVLPEIETSKPTSGLLYFLMDGKHKDKQLEMYYETPAGKLSLRFRK
jgi:hypothetical protein